MKPGFILSIMSAAVIGSGGHSAEGGSFTVFSDSFKNGDYLKNEFSCDGNDLSPDIQWKFAGKAESFALICEDPDAPGGSFIHWVIYNIPGNVHQLRKGYPKLSGKEGTYQGMTDFGKIGYNGPCPPKGKPHRYIFTVYALDKIFTEPNLNSKSLKAVMKGHVLGSASITGMYKR